MEPAAMKWMQGGNYYDLVRSYTVKVRYTVHLIPYSFIYQLS